MNRFLTKFSLLVSLYTVGSLSTLAVDNTCFKDVSIEPGFAAFTTTKTSKLADWYKSVFAMEVVKEFSFPDGSITGTLLRRGEFVAEVFRRDDALVPVNVSAGSKSEQWAGVMKVGIYTNADLTSLKTCLQEKGVQAGRIFKDPLLKVDLLLVKDPEDNMIEVITRHSR